MNVIRILLVSLAGSLVVGPVAAALTIAVTA